VSTIEYWNLAKINGNGNLTAEVTLHWPDGSQHGISNLSDLTIARYDGNQWVSAEPTSTTGTVGTGSIGTNYGMGNFGPFTFGSLGGGNILPIELTTFDATLQQDNTVLLNWETEMEINNDYFTLQRSIDGDYFEEIGTVQGAGNSDRPRQYSFVDKKPASGSNYYRLKQTDLDGKFAYFPVKEVHVRQESTSELIQIMDLYPVPFTNQITVRIDSELPTEAHVELFDMNGAKVGGKAVSLHKGSTTVSMGDVGHLPKGTYVLAVTTPQQRITKKIIKAR
jgi:hypothetical protein